MLNPRNPGVDSVAPEHREPHALGARPRTRVLAPGLCVAEAQILSTASLSRSDEQFAASDCLAGQPGERTRLFRSHLAPTNHLVAVPCNRQGGLLPPRSHSSTTPVAPACPIGSSGPGAFLSSRQLRTLTEGGAS